MQHRIAKLIATLADDLGVSDHAQGLLLLAAGVVILLVAYSLAQV